MKVMKIRDYPEEIQELIKIRYTEDRSEPFKDSFLDKSLSSAFTFSLTPEGGQFWVNINNRDFREFYKRYPQENKDPFKLINCVKSGSTVIYYGKVKGRKVKIEITYE
jgi:hypothetical protein